MLILKLKDTPWLAKSTLHFAVADAVPTHMEIAAVAVGHLLSRAATVYEMHTTSPPGPCGEVFISTYYAEYDCTSLVPGFEKNQNALHER